MASTTEAKTAKENRLRLFREDGDRAMKEATENAVAVRKNMTRLRELRLAKEADVASAAQADPGGEPARPGKRRMKRRSQ